MESNRKIFKTTDVDGKTIGLSIIKPTNKISQDANMAYNLKMAQLIRQGALDDSKRLLLRSELENYLSQIGIWTNMDTTEVNQLAMEIRAYELMLKKGGLKLSEGRVIALQMAEKRQIIMDKHVKRQQFDSATVESQAENFRFEFLIVRCATFSDTGALFFKNHEDYINRQDEIAVMDCAKILANMIYNLEDNMTKSMFEIQWLKDAKMIDDDGRYILADGTISDQDGHAINNEGRRINSEGIMVDTLGREVDVNGNILVDISKPFIDDVTGDPVIVGEIGAKKKNKKSTIKKKTSTRKKKTKIES